MSLLLDALRRAEEARRAKEVDSTTAPEVRKSKHGMPAPSPSIPPTGFTTGEYGGVTPENEPGSPPDSAPYGNLALEELEYSVEDSASATVPVPQAVRSRNTLESVASKDHTQREAARNVFAAKQTTAQPSSASDKRKWLLPLIAAAVVSVGAGGWYVWNEINRVSAPMVARAPQSAQPAPLPPAATTTGQPGARPATPAEKIEAKIADAPVPPLLPPPLAAAPVPAMPAILKTGKERATTKREALANALRDAPIPKEPPTGLRLARSTEPARLNPELTMAYQSLASGNYAEARRGYAKLVANEPLNVDALLGLATAAARGGDGPAAVQHYRQVLALDPRNGLAIMALVALNEGAPSASLEIELKTLVARNPDAAPLQFALGNLYAAQFRWTEAQQAYFESFRIEPLNPDYLFNLAVSLDQLRQTRLALDYYRRAEAIAISNGGGQFDRNTVAKRINELGAETGRNK